MKIFIDNVIVAGEDKGELFIECHDDRNVEVIIYKLNDKGNIAQKHLGYFRNNNQALKECLKLQIHSTTVKTIHEVMKDNERLDKKIDDYIFKVAAAVVENVDISA